MTRRRDEIRETLRRRVMNGLHLGVMKPGARLASARETARKLGTDYRVVVAAVRALEHDGLLEIRPRAGIFVRRDAAAPDAAALAGLGHRVVDLLVDEVAIGLPAPGLLERVRRCLSTVRLHAACVECNQDQLDALCHELTATYGLESTGVELDRLRGRPTAPALVRADLIVSTTHHATEVRRLAAKLDKPHVIVTLDPAWRAEIERLLLEGLVYFVGTDPRWAAKARAIWGGVAGAANLRPVTLGHDPVDDIPPQAAVMVMPGARRALAGTPLLERALPSRGFSRDSARQILTFVVQANVTAWLAGSRPGGR
jgi:DNA-binding transcriptional regulator YhcF (GntR family)